MEVDYSIVLKNLSDVLDFSGVLALSKVQNISVSDVEKIVKSEKRSSKNRAFNSSSLVSNNIIDIERKIKNTLNVNVKIKEKKGGSGELSLLFMNRIQFKELIYKLIKEEIEI